MSDIFSQEYIQRFKAGLFDELVEYHKPFLLDLGINLSNETNCENIDEKQREKVEKVVNCIEAIMHDRVPSKQIYGVGLTMADSRFLYFYKQLDVAVSEKSREFCDEAMEYAADMDTEELGRLVELQTKTKQANFKQLLEQNYEDVRKCSPELLMQPGALERVQRENYHANTDGPFEEHLVCVMALKASGMFDKNKAHKLKKVKRIGGGYFNDGRSDGITFNFDGEDYEFSNRKENYTNYTKLPVTEKHLEAIKKINASMSNSYNFENVKIAQNMATKNANLDELPVM